METNLEYVLTHCFKTEMIAYLNAHPEDFEEAVWLAITDKQPWSWRAAWLLWSCMTKNDPRIRQYIHAIIDAIPTKADGHRRELLKVLQEMELTEEQQGTLFSICADIWEKIGKSPSVRYQAFRFMVSLARQYPDLANEISLYTRPQYMDTLSPGIKRGVFRLMAEIVNNESDLTSGRLGPA
jgi:hypothetical protein